MQKETFRISYLLQIVHWYCLFLISFKVRFSLYLKSYHTSCINKNLRYLFNSLELLASGTVMSTKYTGNRKGSKICNKKYYTLKIIIMPFQQGEEFVYIQIKASICTFNFKQYSLSSNII